MASTGVPFTENLDDRPTDGHDDACQARRTTRCCPTSVLSRICTGAANMAQYLLGKNIDLAGSVYANGYTGDVSNAEMYIPKT